jgi:hypothetical protein
MEAFALEISTGKRVRAVLAAHFHIDSSDDTAILSILADWIKLCDEAKNTFKKVDKFGEDENDLKHFDETRKYVCLCFNHLDSTNFQQMAKSTRDGLLYCSKLVEMSNIKTEECIDEQILVKLREEVERNIGNLLHENINEKLKDVLIWNYNNIRESIIKYSLHGVDGLRRAVDLAVTDILIIKDELNLQEEDKKAASNYETVILKINEVVIPVSSYITFLQFLISSGRYVAGLLSGSQ